MVVRGAVGARARNISLVNQAVSLMQVLAVCITTYFMAFIFIDSIALYKFKALWMIVVQLIVSPICRIVKDIVADLVQRSIAANNVLPIIPLPEPAGKRRPTQVPYPMPVSGRRQGFIPLDNLR
jgi:hypothetical protein